MLVVDSSFAALEFLGAVRHHVTVITRLRLDAAPFAPALPRRPGQKGQPRRKGERLPKLTHVLTYPATVWQSTPVPPWYGEGERTVELTSGTAVWFHGGKPVVPIRWILVRDPQGRFEPQAFLCTDVGGATARLVPTTQRFVGRVDAATPGRRARPEATTRRIAFFRSLRHSPDAGADHDLVERC